MANTPIPSRAVEYGSRGTGKSREYTLSPEELEEIRQKYPATKADREFKKPVVQRTKEDLASEKQRLASKEHQIQEEEDDMSGQRTSKEGPSCGLTKKVFLEQIAAGETVASIEKAWGMKYNTLYNWVKNWDCRGITPGNARELLAMMGDGVKTIEPDKTQLLREKEVVPASSQSAEVDLLVAAKKEIAEVRAELQMVKDDFLTIVDERDQLRTELAEVKEMFDKAYQRNVNGNAKIGEHLQAIQELREEVEHWRGQADSAGKTNTQLIVERETAQKELVRAVEENDRLRDEINRMITERDELMAENDRLESQMVASRVEPQLADKPNEVQLLDRSIADLTRARWILNRLTASGE